MDLVELYGQHLLAVVQDTQAALALSAEQGATFSGVAFHAGTPSPYHRDDQYPTFRTVPHFARWAPVPGPGHVLVFRPDQAPRLVQVVPQDYWHESPPVPDHPFADLLEVTRVARADDVAGALGTSLEGCAYVGNDPAFAERLGLGAAVEPPQLLAALDWARATKTDYEVHCLREAARRAGRGHAVVRLGVERGLSERQLHAAYLEATGQLEEDTPYGNIIAWDEKSAVLHYTRRRASSPAPGRTFLIDAGANVHGYASDITRTYVRDGAHPLFVSALARMEELQCELVDATRAGKAYLELHEAALHGVARIACDLGLLGCTPAAAFEEGWVDAFLPHGLGHHLGLQVHDVGGWQQDPQGTIQRPPERFPFLRTTRTLEPGHVVTIEPGLYFVPLLLDPLRESAPGGIFDWSLIDELLPCGGIRVEDDLVVTPDGGAPDNLSRPHVPLAGASV
jgi:Xaa-Pro dipeptidase